MKHTIIQNKQKNIPFIDSSGKLHKKEFKDRKIKRKIDFSEYPKINIAFKIFYLGKNHSGGFAL